MQRIRPHLWFDTEAVEAANLYTSLFDGSAMESVATLRDTPSGDCDVASFSLAGQPFQAISAGPLFKFNPSISFLVSCPTKDEVDRLWSELIKDGSALMPIDSYPFSARYGWLEDRYGLSWQIMHVGEGDLRQKITPMLMFVGAVSGKAEEAIGLYTSVFDNSGIGAVDRWGSGEEPEKEGTLRFAQFELDNYQFAAMDSALDHKFAFNEAISFMVYCDTQDEIDYYWDKLSAVPGAEQCGWLKDRFGVSWQIVPSALDKMMQDSDEQRLRRVTEAFLQMKKFDIAALEEAYSRG